MLISYRYMGRWHSPQEVEIHPPFLRPPYTEAQLEAKILDNGIQNDRHSSRVSIVTSGLQSNVNGFIYFLGLITSLVIWLQGRYKKKKCKCPFLVKKQPGSYGEPVSRCRTSTSSKARASLPWPAPCWHRGWDINDNILTCKCFIEVDSHAWPAILFAESSLLTDAPPTPSMFKYRPAFSSPGRNHSALAHQNKVHLKLQKAVKMKNMDFLCW